MRATTLPVPQGPGAVRVPGVVAGEAEGGEDAARAVEGAAAAGDGRPRLLRGVAYVVPAGRVGGALREQRKGIVSFLGAIQIPAEAAHIPLILTHPMP